MATAMGFREELNSFNEFKKLDYLDEVANLLKTFPNEHKIKLEIIREKEETKVKFPIKSRNKKPSSNLKNIKIKFTDLLKQFNCDHSNCNHTVTVFSQGPKLRNKKHRHRFVMNPREI